MPHFESSRLKIQRANKYIAEIELLVRTFGETDFYAVRVEHDDGMNTVCFDIDTTRFPFNEAALAIGDCLHNLKTALDHMWFQSVLLCGGTPSDWTRFPVFDSGDDLVNTMNSALKKQQITLKVATLMLDAVKPYQGGNLFLYPLHILNILDKHKMLVPVLQLMQISDLRLEDEQGAILPLGACICDSSSRIPLKDTFRKKLTVKDKGHASAAVLFDEGSTLWGEPVVPALHWVAEEVTRTVKAFDIVFG